MQKEEILALNQLIKSMMESSKEIEKAYKQRNVEGFNSAKKTMLSLQKQIAGITGR
jgi:hypothetical protein